MKSYGAIFPIKSSAEWEREAGRQELLELDFMITYIATGLFQTKVEPKCRKISVDFTKERLETFTDWTAEVQRRGLVNRKHTLGISVTEEESDICYTNSKQTQKSSHTAKNRESPTQTRGRNKIKYYYCNKFGHIARVCLKKKAKQNADRSKKDSGKISDRNIKDKQKDCD